MRDGPGNPCILTPPYNLSDLTSIWI